MAFARREILRDPRPAQHEAPGGEIRPFDVFHQLGNRDLWLVDLRTDAVDHFAQIMRREIRGHPHRDPRAAIDQQIGKRRRKDGWLGEALVIVGNEIDRFLIHVLHQRRAQVGEAGLRVTHRRRSIAIH